MSAWLKNRTLTSLLPGRRWLVIAPPYFWLLLFAGHQEALFGLQGWFDLQAYREAARLEMGPPVPFGWSILYLFGQDPVMVTVAYWLALAVLAFVVRGRALVALAGLAIALAAAIGGYHAGVEYGWWEGLTACTSTVTQTGGDPLDAIMNAPLIRCDRPQWTFLHVSLAGFNALFSLSAALAIAVLLARRDRAQ